MIAKKSQFAGTHTPGPWTWRGHVATGIEGPDAQIVADASRSCGAISLDEAKANARLIAAAPDLLDALQEADDLLSENGFTGPTMDVIFAAISKATGGQP